MYIINNVIIIYNYMNLYIFIYIYLHYQSQQHLNALGNFETRSCHTNNIFTVYE